jgi:hypothetical protein
MNEEISYFHHTRKALNILHKATISLQVHLSILLSSLERFPIRITYEHLVKWFGVSKLFRALHN